MSTSLQWWCSARGAAWTWAWQAYPGVWLAVASSATAAAWCGRRLPSPARVRRHRPTRHGRRFASIVGILLLWAALDWPAGPLATGYLASVHALQFIVLAMLVPPLLLLGVDRARLRLRLRAHPRIRRTIRGATQPIIAGVLFTAIMAATHAPRVVDTLMPSQLGAMLLDLSWLVSGLVFWWPVIVRVPAHVRFVRPLHALYLFFGTQAHLLIGMWLLLAKFPVYATYELAPRVSALSALEDQQVAGGIMIAVAEPLVLGAISLVLLRWFAESQR